MASLTTTDTGQWRGVAFFFYLLSAVQSPDVQDPMGRRPDRTARLSPGSTPISPIPHCRKGQAGRRPGLGGRSHRYQTNERARVAWHGKVLEREVGGLERALCGGPFLRSFSGLRWEEEVGRGSLRIQAHANVSRTFTFHGTPASAVVASSPDARCILSLCYLFKYARCDATRRVSNRPRGRAGRSARDAGSSRTFIQRASAGLRPQVWRVSLHGHTISLSRNI